MIRVVETRYEDPLSQIWLKLARSLELSVERSDTVFASIDGRGTLTIGSAETLDADDSLAQMIFHEVCHSLIEGPEAFEVADWGLSNESDQDLYREWASLRVQAFLARPLGLGLFFAPTTDHRWFYDQLGPDPLAGEEGDPELALARLGISRSRRAPWAPHLLSALEATAEIVRLTAPFVEKDSLYGRAEARAPLHPAALHPAALHPAALHPAALHPAALNRSDLPDVGLNTHPRAADLGTCGDCAWSERSEENTGLGCRQLPGTKLSGDWPACTHFEEGPLDCQRCGACCGQAYHVVEVAEDDAFASSHRHLLVLREGRLSLIREDGRCSQLEGEGSASDVFHCTAYDLRPQTCRDFERQGEHCLDARKRLGLSL